MTYTVFECRDSSLGDHTCWYYRRVPLRWNSWEKGVQELWRSTLKWFDGHRIVTSTVIVESSTINMYIWEVSLLMHDFKTCGRAWPESASKTRWGFWQLSVGRYSQRTNLLDTFLNQISVSFRESSNLEEVEIPRCWAVLQMRPDEWDVQL